MKGWMLWKYLVKRAARMYDVLDPFTFLARLHRFAEPSEIQEPIELLRAGILFHARGLINTKAIQHNLDWVWPYWVERQFDPNDVSFIPRAFSFSHVNLTHRNWTAVGLPDLPLYPIVDPRGLVTPFYDGWSLDFWLVSEQGRMLLPSRLPEVEQHWTLDDDPAIRTICETADMRLASRVSMEAEGGEIRLRIAIFGQSAEKGWLAVTLRPYNPEGVQFIEQIEYDPEKLVLTVNGKKSLLLETRPEKVLFSTYQNGDVARQLGGENASTSVSCETGMATGALLFPMDAGRMTRVNCSVPLEPELEDNFPGAGPGSWPDILSRTAKLALPDPELQRLYDIAVRTVIHLSAAEPVPGPYTYKRFWYRDACFLINAVLATGLEERALRLMKQFPSRQQRSGYYRSQNGEWDSNGQVLWLVHRFQQLSGLEITEKLLNSVVAGAGWIREKRRETTGSHAGLLPPGFSAEHFGPNDYYYWDDFWAVAGLRGAGRLCRHHGKNQPWIEEEADSLFKTVIASLEASMERRKQGGMPASPNRRLDAGAIGSLVADYPLQLFEPDHSWVRETVAFLLDQCMQKGGFFQDIIHSGINPYLTLAIAQSLLRQGDRRCRHLVKSVASLASPTGQWPEAIHPLTGGGCMGDGQHGWAAAEWILMMRNIFIREEGSRLVIGSGIFPEWLEEKGVVAFGPTPTPYGPVRVEIHCLEEKCLLNVQAAWRGKEPDLSVQVPGYRSRRVSADGNEFLLETENRGLRTED